MANESMNGQLIKQ